MRVDYGVCQSQWYYRVEKCNECVRKGIVSGNATDFIPHVLSVYGILPHDDLLYVHDAYMYDEYDNCLADSVTCLNPCDSSKRGDQVIML